MQYSLAESTLLALRTVFFDAAATIAVHLVMFDAQGGICPFNVCPCAVYNQSCMTCSQCNNPTGAAAMTGSRLIGKC